MKPLCNHRRTRNRHCCLVSQRHQLASWRTTGVVQLACNGLAAGVMVELNQWISKVDEFSSLSACTADILPTNNVSKTLCWHKIASERWLHLHSELIQAQWSLRVLIHPGPYNLKCQVKMVFGEHEVMSLLILKTFQFC